MREITKPGFLAFMILVLAFALGSSVMAFHDAATIKCMACHTMHASEDGSPANITSANGFDAADGSLTGPVAHLLVQANKTDLCLACHSTNKQMGSEYAPDVYNVTAGYVSPGGDYDLVQENAHNPYFATGGTIDQDTTFPTNSPPGNTGTLWEWSCCSCHRPHKDVTATGDKGTYAYRLLRKQLKGVGAADVYTPVDTALSLGDTHKVWPLADGSGNFNAEADGSHNVYLVDPVNNTDEGFGAWCGGCHGGFHGLTAEKSGSDWIRHPTYQPLGTVIGPNYTSTYDPAIPVEVNGSAGLTKATVALTSQNSNAQVFCLSCHRAHGAEANIVRWDSTEAAGVGTRCNKCHKKGS